MHVIIRPSFREEIRAVTQRNAVYAFAYRFYFYYEVKAICDAPKRQSV